MWGEWLWRRDTLQFSVTYVQGPEVQIRNNPLQLPQMARLTTWWTSGFRHCQSLRPGTFYGENTGDGVRTVVLSPVDRISTQKCVQGIHGSNEDIIS